MFQALNMDLEIVRTVLENDVNEILVCADRKRDTGEFYTVISISSREVRRFVVDQTMNGGLFENNSDYMGSFNYRDSMNLVFRFQEESLLKDKEDLYTLTFAKRKEAALSLVTACAEAGVTGCVGELLLTSQNMNLSPDGKIYFNYFLDFAALARIDTEQSYYRKVAMEAYGIVSRDYRRKYEGDIEKYPSELQVFFKKSQEKCFNSYSQIIAFLRSLPDVPEESHFGFGKILHKLAGWKNRFAKHSLTIFIVCMVLVTIVYTVYQISMRMTAAKSKQENTTYMGVDTIGEVYLGEEDV